MLMKIELLYVLICSSVLHQGGRSRNRLSSPSPQHRSKPNSPDISLNNDGTHFLTSSPSPHNGHSSRSSRNTSWLRDSRQRSSSESRIPSSGSPADSIKTVRPDLLPNHEPDEKKSPESPDRDEDVSVAALIPSTVASVVPAALLPVPVAPPLEATPVSDRMAVVFKDATPVKVDSFAAESSVPMEDVRFGSWTPGVFLLLLTIVVHFICRYF